MKSLMVTAPVRVNMFDGLRNALNVEKCSIDFLNLFSDGVFGRVLVMNLNSGRRIDQFEAMVLTITLSPFSRILLSV